MTEKFKKAMQVVFDHEGGLSDDPDDPGGITKYGISLRFLLAENELELGDIDDDGDIDGNDIRALSKEDAAKIYYAAWWKRYKYEQIQDFILATKVFDTAVNIGAQQAHRFLQRACVAYEIPLKIDGNLGPRTMFAIDLLNSMGRTGMILENFRSQQAAFYKGLAARKPTLAKYLKGWLRRAAS